MNPPKVKTFDWFAGQAMMGLIINPTVEIDPSAPWEIHANELARRAYIVAEAMTLERKRYETLPRL